MSSADKSHPLTKLEARRIWLRAQRLDTSVPFGAGSGWSWGLSIVLLVMLMRLIMVPLFVKQVRSQRKMQAHIDELEVRCQTVDGDTKVVVAPTAPPKRID